MSQINDRFGPVNISDEAHFTQVSQTNPKLADLAENVAVLSQQTIGSNATDATDATDITLPDSLNDEILQEFVSSDFSLDSVEPSDDANPKLSNSELKAKISSTTEQVESCNSLLDSPEQLAKSTVLIKTSNQGIFLSTIEAESSGSITSFLHSNTVALRSGDKLFVDESLGLVEGEKIEVMTPEGERVTLTVVHMTEEQVKRFKEALAKQRSLLEDTPKSVQEEKTEKKGRDEEILLKGRHKAITEPIKLLKKPFWEVHKAKEFIRMMAEFKLMESTNKLIAEKQKTEEVIDKERFIRRKEDEKWDLDHTRLKNDETIVAKEYSQNQRINNKVQPIKITKTGRRRQI